MICKQKNLVKVLLLAVVVSLFTIVAAEPRCRKIDGVVCRRAPRNLSQNE